MDSVSKAADISQRPLTCAIANKHLHLYKILYSHMNNPIVGQTKNVLNYISATHTDGHTEILFTPLAPFETPEALDRICEEYNLVIGNFEVEPLIVIPIFIHDFLCIHPFNDEEKMPAIDIVRKATINKIGKFMKQDIRELCSALSVISIEGALRKLVKADLRADV